MAEQWTFKKGLVETGNGIYAYLQPDGGWGWSNAGLVTDGDQSLLVDTLFDAKLTREMLSTMADAANVKAEDIGTVVNTHANGDHTHGNGLCTQAEIIASEASANEMVPASGLQQLMQGAADYGEVGQYFLDAFGAFDFADVAEKMPTKTFNGEMTVTVGDKTVELIEVGPAHTAGDVLVYVPGDSTVFTGDILFIDGTPLMWNGPVSNWIRACERIIEMKPDVIVPGHGPITDIAGVKRVQEYLAYIDTEARKRFDDGMSVREAALDIAITDYESWLDSERIAINVNTLYREYSGTEEAPNIIELFTMMAEVRRARA